MTHLLKLEPPYRFIFDRKYGRAGKVIAVLLKEKEDPDDSEFGRTVSVPIVDLAYTWDGTDLAECIVLCDEFTPRITFDMFIHCLMTTTRSTWFPNGIFSVYSFGRELNDLGVRVLFPGEGETEGQSDVSMKTTLRLGIDKGEYWVENSYGGFYFEGRYPSLESMRLAILDRRDDYYRAFPQKRFHIALSTDNPDFQGFVEDINNTPYDHNE